MTIPKRQTVLLLISCCVMVGMIAGCGKKKAVQTDRVKENRHIGAIDRAKQDTIALRNVIQEANAAGLVKGKAIDESSVPQEKAAGKASDTLVYLKVKSAEVSSFESTPDWAPKPDPMAPVDGDLATRWSPELGSDNEWIYFDFGKKKTLEKIVIRWEAAYATIYEILSSDDARNWTRIILNEDGQGGDEELTFAPVSCRYVKLVGKERVNEGWGFSMWEFEMYGKKERNPDDTTLEETFPVRAKKADEALEAVAIAEGEIVPSPGKLGKDEFHRGINYTSWSSEELSGAESDASLAYISELGAGHVSLMAVWYQESIDASEIVIDKNKTITDEALGHAINVIHKLGMKVMLKPHIDLVDEEMRTCIIPNDAWFESYRCFIVHYAQLAERYNVELFCIGTELSSTTIAHWKEAWYKVIDEVKKAYSGPLIYAANWDEYETVSFWDRVDIVGIDAYFPLTKKNDPAKEELVASWGRIAGSLEAWLVRNGLTGKGVVFTEIGYDAVDGSNTRPWRVLPTSADLVEDQQEQADCLDSLFTVLAEKEWFKGIYWWNYFPRSDIGALGYTLRGKIGEPVLSEWFEKKK